MRISSAGVVIFVLTVLWCAAGLSAGAASTQPFSSPTDTFRAFLLDLTAGNAADLPTICSARGAAARSLLKDLQAIASSMAYLDNTATKRFGPDAAAAIVPTLPSLSDLDDTSEKITGDTAEISGGAALPVRLIRMGGQWKLDLDWLVQSDDMPANPRWFADMAAAMHRTADDISSGRLTTVDAATTAMEARQRAIPDSTADTRRADAPATQP